MALLSDVQSQLKDQSIAWVAEQSPVRKFRDMRDQGIDHGFVTEIWQAMVDMGWTGILIPETYGGSGLDYQTFGLVLEQLGRQLVASPLFASAYVGATAIVLAGDDFQKQKFLPGIVNGTEILTLAVDEGPRHEPQSSMDAATKSSDGFRLNGKKTFVLEGMAATSFVVPMRTTDAVGAKDGLTLFLVPADTPGVSRERLVTMDSRGYASVHFENVSVGKGSVLGEIGQGDALLEKVLERACAGLAAEMHGTASAAFEMTLDYLKTREQFGKIIGSFQALGHRAAALFTKMELSRSCQEAALQGLDDQSKNVAELCSLAKCKVGEFLYHMSNELIQMHGGIGVTDEFDAGLYLKRARVLETLYGNQAFHRDRYARLRGF